MQPGWAPNAVVVDADSIYLTDTDGADILSQVAEELRARGPRSSSRRPPAGPRALAARRRGRRDRRGRRLRDGRRRRPRGQRANPGHRRSALLRPVRCLTDPRAPVPCRASHGRPTGGDPAASDAGAAAAPATVRRAPATDRAYAAPSVAALVRHASPDSDDAQVDTSDRGSKAQLPGARRENVASAVRSSRIGLAGRSQKSPPAFELIESKLRPPQTRTGGVARAKRHQRARDGHARCRSSSLPRARVGQDDPARTVGRGLERPFAWLAIDERDNDPIVLLTYVAAALDRIEALDQGLRRALVARRVAGDHGGAAPRCRASRMTQPIVLVLDELQLLEARQAWMRWPPSRARPGDSQLVLSARGVPAVPLDASRPRPGARGGRRRPAHGSRRGAPAAPRSRRDLPEDDVDELTEQTEGWSAGLYLAALSIQARGSGRRRRRLHREQPPRLGLPALGAARALLRGRAPLPDPDLRARAAVGAALRRGARGERLRGDAGVAGPLQPVPGAARRPWGVVPLPPPLPGAPPCGADPKRAGSRAGAPARQPIGARRTGSPRRRSATRSRPATSTAWRGWSSSAPPAYQSGRVATAERWFEWLEARGALQRTRRPCSARWSPRSGAAGGGRARAAAPRAGVHEDGLPAVVRRSTPGWPSCARCAAAGAWRRCGRMLSRPGTCSP